MKKILRFTLAALLLVAGTLSLHLFVIGDPVDGSLVACDVTEDDNQLNIHVTTLACLCPRYHGTGGTHRCSFW